jgi:hypothetical protein
MRLGRAQNKYGRCKEEEIFSFFGESNYDFADAQQIAWSLPSLSYLSSIFICDLIHHPISSSDYCVE